MKTRKDIPGTKLADNIETNTAVENAITALKLCASKCALRGHPLRGITFIADDNGNTTLRVRYRKKGQPQ